MKQRIHVFGAVTVLVLTLCATTIVAQESESDICVLEHLTAKALTGTVVSARLENEIEKPLPGAVVELRHIGKQHVMAKTITDSNGHFILPDVSPGTYSLAAKPPARYRVALFSTAVELRLSSAKTGKQNREIILALGWLFNGCHGGYAAVRSKSK
jgi:uncharacterized surface anchored protein